MFRKIRYLDGCPVEIVRTLSDGIVEYRKMSIIAGHFQFADGKIYKIARSSASPLNHTYQCRKEDLSDTCLGYKSFHANFISQIEDMRNRISTIDKEMMSKELSLKSLNESVKRREGHLAGVDRDLNERKSMKERYDKQINVIDEDLKQKKEDLRAAEENLKNIISTINIIESSKKNQERRTE